MLYVAFGSQAEMAPEQLHEIAMGLERSEVAFLWVLSSKVQEKHEFVKGFEERLKKRKNGWTKGSYWHTRASRGL